MNSDAKLSRKYKQTKFSSTVEGLYAMTKWDLFLNARMVNCVAYFMTIISGERKGMKREEM